jgi:hypothetical protein
MIIIGGSGGGGGGGYGGGNIFGGAAYDAETERLRRDLEKKIKGHQELKRQLAEIDRQRALEQDRKKKRQRPNQSGI